MTYLITMMDSGFITGFRGTMLSLLKSNSNFEVPLIVLDNGLKDTDKSLMMNLYPFIIFFREIPKGKYHFSEDSAVKKLNQYLLQTWKCSTGKYLSRRCR